MAYFPNGTSGECFGEQCARCRFGDDPCPIAWVQLAYNYKACNNEVASKILADLVKDDGTCAMFEMAPRVFGLRPVRKSVERHERLKRLALPERKP